MKDRYQAFNEKTIAKFLMRGWLYPTAFFFLLASILPSADAQCILRISSVDVSCNYANGTNEFSVAVAVEYQAGGAISPIQVSVGGQSQLFTPAASGGVHTFSGFSLPSPGMGYPVTAQFTNGNACQVFSTADAIACTPACPGTPASLGGMAWAEVTPDGAFDNEPGQPNVKVEVYDCEGQLRGTAFTNAEGRWSVSGLNAGEEYRVEFSAQQVPGISPSLAGPDNGSPVQFATAGDCAVNAAFLDLSAGDCFNREDAAAADCSGPPNVLDWSAYAEGANPFSRPPFSVDVNTDKVSWARTMDGATPYAHKVYHSRFGGEEAYYLLETEANNNTPGSESGVGAVFAFSRPVAGLSFTLLDIDISGSAVDRVAVHGFLGGAPVPLSLPEITAGSAVSVLEPFLFEGASPVGDDSNAGNVAIRFNEPVDQVAITLFSVAAADLGSIVQSIGIGNMSWCREPAPLSPGCTRIFDWMGFPDNDDGPTPYVMDEVELAVTGNDPFGIASSSAFMVDNDFSPEGGQRGFWGIAMDASAPDQFVESTITFSQPVSLLTFTILDIDQADWDGLPGFSYQDQVSVRGFLGGEEVLLSLSDITPGLGGLGSVVGVSSPNLYAGNGRGASGTSADGNLTVAFPQEVDSVVVRLSPGPDGPSNPAGQQIGLSDINFCICEPAPLQLGDLIWEDENGDGVQDACEPPLAGLPVALYDEAGTLLATTRSSPEGRYHFTRSGTVGENWLADGQVEPNTSYFIVLGSGNDSLPNDYTWVNGAPYLITTRFVGAGTNPFMNDSDPDPNNLSSNMPGDIPGRLPYIKVTTGGPGQVNTTLDAGFRPARFDMALRKVVHEDLTPPPFAPGDIVSFVITVYNQGAIPADSLRIADYYPSDALVLEDTANWSVVNGVAVSRNALPVMAPGDYRVLSISFRIKPSFTGDTIINRAEIYQAFNSIDADDEDSFPDLIPDNDAGGAPGSGADDAVDGDGTGPVNGTDAATDEDDHDAALIVVDGAPAFDLALDLTLDGDGPFYPGDNVTFIIEVINEGALDATAVQLNNYIPAGLILNDPQWTAANGTARLVAPIASLPTGSSAFREITFQVAPGFSGPSITNTAEIAAAANALGESDGDSTPGNQVPSEDDQASATLTVTPVFDLSLVKEVVSPGPFSPGSTVTFSIRITNEGTVAAQNVQISDYIPYGLTLNNNSWSVTGNVARLNNLIPNIAPGNTVNRQITFVIDPNFWGTSLVNTAEIQSAANTQGLDDRDSTPGNGSTQEDDDGNATIAIQQPTPVFDLALKKEVNYAETPGPFHPGDHISFNITIVNEGNVKARSIQVADHLPEGLVLDDPGWISYGDLAVIASPISSLEGGQSVTVTIRLRIGDDFRGEELVNEAEVYSVFNDDWLDDVDSNPGNGVGLYEDDEGAAIVPVEQKAPAFDLALTKKIKTSATPGPFFPGSTVTFTIRVSNEGNIDASQVSIIDYIPPGLELADPDWSQVFGSAVLNTPIANLAAGATVGVDITFVIRDDFTGLSITNKAEVNSATNSSSMPDEDSSPANGRPGEDDMDEAVVQVRQTYDLALAKTLNTTLTPGPFQPGGQVAFNLTVYNQGSLAAANITLFDYYPPGLILNDNNWQAVQGNILRLANPIPSLAPGQSVTVPILFDISPNLVNGDSLVNCAEIGGPTNVNGLPDADSTPANGSHDEDDDDTETIWIAVPKRFDLALSKTVNAAQTPPPYYPGSTVSYRITVKNEGDETARNVHIQDYIPQGLILTSADWSALGSIAQLNSPIPGILPGDSATVDINFAISPVFQGTSLSNYAEIAPATTSSNPADADSTPGNGSAGPGEDDYDGAAITVSRQDFDLSLRKRVKSSVTPGPFVPGSTVTFEIEISNEGDLLAQNIQLREYFPVGLILADPFWNAVGNVAELAFPIGSLAPGATTVVDVTFTVAPGFSGASLANYAEVGSAFNILGYDDMDSTPGNGSLGPDEDDYDGATITVLQQEFDLALSKALQASATPGPFFPGSLVTYRITVTNEGDLEAQNVQLRDYIPLGLVLADNNWTLNGSMAVRYIGNLAPGATASFDISFTVSPAFAGSVLVNRAEVGAASNTMGIPDKDSTPGNGAAGPNEDDYDDATINIIQDEFDLALTKELNASLTPGPFVPGNAVTFRLTVTNQGDLVAQNIQLRDYVPLGLILADNNWTLNGSTAVRNIGNLQPGASATVNISFTISPTFSGLSIANFAEVGAASNIYGLPDTDSTPGNGPAGPNEDDYGSAAIDIIQAEFDLALTKELNTALTPGPFVPGSTVTYRLTLSNEGEVAAQNVQLWDYIPLGLILADNNWSSNGNVASRTVGNLAPGASVTFNITFTIASNFSGTAIANYAEIGAAANIYGLDDRDSTPGNSSSGTGEDDFDGATINVVQQPFDLALAKELKVSATPGPFYPGSTVTFRITVTNEGGIAAQNVQVRDYIPLGLILADNNWTLNGSMAYRNIGVLQPGAVATVDISFTISPNFTGLFITNYGEIGAASNTVGLGDTDSTPGNGSAGFNEDDFDSAGITVNPPQQFDLTLSKSVSSSTPGPYLPGSPVTFRLTVTNQGNVTAQNIQLWDYLPAGLTLSDNTWTLNGGLASYNTPIASLAAGASQTVEIDFVVAAGSGGTQIVNYAEIGAASNSAGLNDTDSTPGNGASGANEDDYDSAGITVSVPQVFDLALSKAVSSSTPGPYSEGSPVTFELTITNQGNVTAQSIQLWDYLPAGLTLSDNTWTANGGVASLNSPIASLAPGATQTVEIDFVVAAGFAGTQAVNYAEIGAAFNGGGLNDADSTPGNGASGANEDDYDSAGISIVVPQVFDLALSKSLSSSTPGPYVAGSPVTFRLRVTNQGNVAAQNIQLLDYLPAGLTLSDNTWTANGGVASLNSPIASLAPGATQDVEIDFVVAPGFAGMQIVNYAEIGAASNSQGLNDVDSTPGNGASAPGEDDYDDSSINVTAPQVFDLALSKAVSPSTPGPYSEGSAVTFILTVTNEGNVAAQNIQLRDYLPAGLTLSDNTWTANGGVSSLNSPIASLAPGAVQTVEIDFVVAAGFAGTQAVNYAEIGAAFNGGGLNDTDSTPGNGASGANEDDYDSASISIVVPQVFDLALSKSVSSSTPGPYVAGSPVTFRLRVTNQGNVAVQNIQLLDYLPAGLTLSDNTWTANGGVASLNSPIASLALGATQDVEIDFVVAPGFAGMQIVNYAEIGAASNSQGLNDVDSTPGNGASAPGEDDYDDSSINITAPQVFDLALSKAVSPSTPGPYSEGSAVTFILTVTNEGNVAAQNIQLWDYLPAGLTLSDNTWTANGGVASLNSPIASLAPGATQTVEIDFVVAAGFAGTAITNFAEIFSASNGAGLNDADSTPGNGAAGNNEDDFDSANITVSATPVFDLALRKRLKTSATPGPFSPGSAVTFRITVMNQGNMDAYNVEVVDYIPAGLSLSDPNWVQAGTIARRTIPGPVPANGGTAVLDISFVISQNFTGSTIVNYAEIRSADDDTNPGNTPPVDVDSQYDENPANDAGGLANSPSDDALNGNGTGQPGSSSAVTDEDDQDPALITVGNCPGAGLDGAIDVCLTCTSTNITVNLPAALGGVPSPGGTWADLDGAGVSLANPSSVNLDGLSSGDYRFRYTVGGQSGCPIVSAIVTVSLASNLDYACNGAVNVPLGDRCEVLVVPDMILEGGSDGCADGLIVNLLDPNGVSLGNVITVAQAGQTLIAEVLDPFCGLVCWGYVNVQDFTPPAISCPAQDVDLICSDLDSILNNPASLAVTGTPEIFDTCVQHTVAFQDQMVMTPDCVDRQINRTFTVTDPLGNSAQCVQVITIRNPDFSDLLPLPSLVEIPCDSSFAVDQNGNPHPSVTGYPLVQTYFGPKPLNQAFCSLGASYTDSAPIVVCDGTTRFIRRWDILDWCDNSGNNILQLTQSIKVGDVDGPIVSCPEIDITGDGYPDPLQFSTVPFECTGAFVAPLPNVTDNCSGWEVRTEIVTDEVVPVTNQYGIVIGYDTVATLLATILPGEPRFVSGIPVGCHRFRYKVTDDCNNFTLLECNFCVVDDVEPTAVCNDSLNISIGGQGVGRVYATDVNEGSTDNCGIDSLLVRRRFDVDPATCDSVAPYYSDWAPYVDFFCCDVNQTVTVELLVIDVHGNENTCWLTALVEDKVRPVCNAPNDTTVSCSSLPANFDPYDTSQLQALFGAATATDGCGGAIAVEQPPAVNLDQCGAGTVIRTFQGVDLAGNLSLNACTQVITIGAEFNYQIKFPKDVTTNCTAPTPDTLIYDSFGCDLLSVSVTDEVFTPLLGGTGPECYKIFRKYRVLNWCEYDGVSDAVVIGRNEDCDGVTGDEDVWVVRQPGGAFVDRDNNPQNTIPAFGAKGLACDGTTNPTGYWRTVSSVGLWEYTQIIKVMDTIPPQVSFTVPGAFCSYDAANCTGQVTYPFSVSEDCSANGLDVEVFLDAGADGVIDQDLTNTGALSGSYPNFTIQGVFPVGNHAFIVQASDGCGNNMASATLPFEVVDCAPPAFTCLNGLSFNLMPLPPNTDFDGDGDFDIAGAAIWASDFVLDAADCSDDTIAYSINRVGEAPDINRRALYFTCEDTGTIAIQVYVWDSADNPYAVQPDGTVGGFNYGYCDTYVIVQDNNNACNAGLMMAGLIAREDDMGVEGVEVSLSGPMNLMMLTAADGSYQFDDLETGYDYSIRPYLNTGHRNGISTFDLLIIQQHLLGVQPLDSPYKRIAADANRTNSITTLDMIQIQQLILGEILEFPNNTSWRFVDKNFIFPVPLNPWFTPFPEVINVNDLAYPQMANDFVAIKIGDVNNSAVTTNLQRVQGRRLAGTFYLEAPALSVARGETVTVPVSGRNLEAIRGCQFTLDFDQSVLELIDIEYGLADKNSIGLHGVPEGYLTGSWYRRDGLEYPEGEPLFTLRLRAKADVPLSRLLSVSSRYTLAEAYTPGNELLDVSLAFGGGGPLPEPAFRLYQNRPNPFSEETVVGFELPESGTAQLKVYDVNGKVVYEQERVFEKGYNQLILKGADLSPGGIGGGVLYYRLQMGDRVVARKMIMLE